MEAIMGGLVEYSRINILGEKMNKIQELIQQKLALEIANKALQIAGLEAELAQAREKITKLESQLEPAADLKGGDK